MEIPTRFSNDFFKVSGLFIFVSLCFIPLFINFPYRPNLYLTWEGAYRLYLGQIPYKDFGTSVGPGLWLIPALFFKIFGPFTSALIKAQIFINILSGFVLRGILKKLDVKEPIIFITLVLFYGTYVIVHFWPWYNHTVFVYQLLSIYFVLISYYTKKISKHGLYLLIASIFTFLSFITKQDGGGITFLICNLLILILSLKRLKISSIIYYNIGFIILITLSILVLKPFDLYYWFNLGQSPHTSRLYIMDFMNDFFNQSIVIKFFIFSLLFLFFRNIEMKQNRLLTILRSMDEKYLILSTLCFLILGEALIIQVTSFSPPETINYYISFGVLFLLYSATKSKAVDLYRITWFSFTLIAVITIWSENYWTYSKKVFPKVFTKDNLDYTISKYNLSNLPNDSAEINPNFKLELTNLKSVDNIKFPLPSKEGLMDLMELRKRYGDEIRVLNMTQLTFLAFEMKFTPETSKYQPLWYHKGVNVFDREIDYLCDKVKNNTYDIILFQDIPPLRDYFPYEVMDCAKFGYVKEFEFPSTWNYLDSKIEVYVLK